MNKLNYLLLIVITCVLSFVRCTNNSAPPAFQTQNPDSIKITQKENESLGNLFDIVDSARLVRFEYEIDRIEQRYKFEKPAKNAILFVGSSSIRKWKTLEKDMKPLHVINHGFGGSTIPELLFYADRIIFPHKPKTIVFYAGDNDLGHKNAHPKMSLRLFKLFAQTVSERLPKTNIYFLSIKPSPRRKDFWDSMNNGNRLIKKYIDKQNNIFYIDVSSKMFDENQRMISRLYLKDSLHLSSLGYELWTSIIKPVLERQEKVDVFFNRLIVKD